MIELLLLVGYLSHSFYVKDLVAHEALFSVSEPSQELVILFADITGSTGMYERYGDEKTQEIVSNCLSVLIAETEKANGILVQTVGDEVMARFATADDAFRAAVAMQQAHADGPVSIRVGFHLGQVIQKGTNFYGNAVNVAARMATRATAGEIMTTGETVDRLSPQYREKVRHLDTTTVKGKQQRIAIYEAIWQSEDQGDRTILRGVATPSEVADNIKMEISYQGKTFIVDGSRRQFSIGRDPSNDLVLRDEETFASRKHANIEFTRGKFLLTDQSSNGTYLELLSGQVTVLKREAIELIGSGNIGLGKKPERDGLGVIRFRRID